MAGPLSSPQGLRIVTVKNNYNATARTLQRQTQVTGVDGSGNPIWTIVATALRRGLKIGVNLQSQHDLEKVGNLAQLHWAVVNDGDPFPSRLVTVTEDDVMSRHLKDLFDTDGKWFGFNLAAIASPPANPVLCFEMNARNFEVKGKWSFYPMHIVAVEARSDFDDHFVLGIGLGNAGKANGAVDYRSTVISFP